MARADVGIIDKPMNGADVGVGGGGEEVLLETGGADHGAHTEVACVDQHGSGARVR
jgi:hypothetical protein